MKSPTNIHLTSGQQENILSNSEADFEHYDLTVTMSELCVKGIINILWGQASGEPLAKKSWEWISRKMDLTLGFNNKDMSQTSKNENTDLWR